MSDDPRQNTAMVDVDGNVAPRLDTRILNKIPLLQGRDTAEFRSWQFVLKASLGLVDTAYSTDLPHVEALRSPMTQPENVDTKARSEKLYFILALTTAHHAPGDRATGSNQVTDTRRTDDSWKLTILRRRCEVCR